MMAPRSLVIQTYTSKLLFILINISTLENQQNHLVSCANANLESTRARTCIFVMHRGCCLLLSVKMKTLAH